MGSGKSSRFKKADFAKREGTPDSDDVAAHRRKKPKINYNEDSMFGELDDEVDEDDDEAGLDGVVKLDSGVESPDDDGSPRRSRRSRNGSAKAEEDEYVEGDDDDPEPDQEGSEYSFESDDSEARAERRRNRIPSFVVKDDEDNDDEDDEYRFDRQRSHKRSQKRGRSGRRGRPRTKVRDDEEDSEEEEEEEEPLTLADELNDLQDSEPDSPIETRKIQLRQRKEVNYTLPPPITSEAQLELAAAPVPSPSRRRANGNSGALRRLFPTSGPFGGGDVASVFGQNIPGLGAAATVGNVDSSDSDDEELFKAVTPGNARGFAPIGVQKKKKNTLADTDPLGIDTNIDFSAVGGLENYVDQLKEMVMIPLLYPELYQRFDKTPPRGVLFHGPPGTGKTLMARALAASCSTGNQKITFFMRKGADCLSKWVGEAERNLRLLFEEAKNQQPSIIFFDEIDGLAPVRSSKQEQIHASIVSTLLALMDGIDNRGQIIVIGATNRPDSVDPALRRPGRFDREFYFPLPDMDARKKILTIQTRKWESPPKPEFIEKLSMLTKGYGGADLRALTVEASLNAIQRTYPQIYESQEKLKLDINKINVTARDFMRALDKIIPSSARSSSSSSSPLPKPLEPLLSRSLGHILSKLDRLIPRDKQPTQLEEARYVDLFERDADSGFHRQEVLENISRARCFRPRLLIRGGIGMGQTYIGNAILHHMEGFHVQSLDLSRVFGDPAVSPEGVIIQTFIEARRHKRSVIFLPSLEIWLSTVPATAKLTLASLLRSLTATEQILVLGICEMSDFESKELVYEADEVLGFGSSIVDILEPSKEEREEYFETLWSALKMDPAQFNDLDSRPVRDIPKLEVIEPVAASSEDANTKREKKRLERHDMRLKNTLKIRLSGLMDLFKNRYKRFKKPTIDDMYLIHLFDESVPPPIDPLTGEPLVQQPYVKDGEMILEVSTGKHYYNIDLDIIEERLWNGFYCEPRQFLKDIEMIYKDAQVFGDRERLLKASEMYANAQVGVDEISVPEFVAECREMHVRETERQKEWLLKQQRPIVIDEESGVENGDIENGNSEVIEVDDGDVTVPDAVPDTVTAPVTVNEVVIKDESLPITESIVKPKTYQLVVSEPKLHEVKTALLTISKTLSIEKLEEVNASLLDIVWQARKDVDKTNALDAMLREVERHER
ncbi:unnamed protein product [Kuraishia capsulata CBS 1993]|uniref:Bromo domain-containing protein n=1 Tax=Kuraishia capsulata CBS 1993 TaxID=1382522 RepID=W6MPY9_9ASCO|nr:uncharacterized protein KUCA_T00003260001 [Kuraishia capsulata CBS 1993]CDK27282.1 unnamed protein product [Kuraishia capsulata CBS 1993]